MSAQWNVIPARHFMGACISRIISSPLLYSDMGNLSNVIENNSVCCYSMMDLLLSLDIASVDASLIFT